MALAENERPSDEAPDLCPGPSADEALHGHLLRSQSSIYCVWLAFMLVFGYGLDVYLFLRYEELSGRWSLETLGVSAMFTFRMIFITLAPLVHDMAFTQLVIIWDITVVLFTRMVLLYYSFDFTETPIVYGGTLVFIVVGIWALRSASPIDAQRRVWLGLGILEGSYLLQRLVDIVYSVATHQRVSLWLALSVVAPVSVLYIALRPRLRRQFQGRVHLWVERRAVRHRATNLASVFGSVPPPKAREMARQRFACIRYNQLTFEILAGSAQCSTHTALAKPCALEACDAYVSHSWGDNGQLKWEILQAWGADFFQRHGREPLLWIDRCCCDATCTDMHLPCLPVFLQGCKRLVVLCGPTYMGRLWCILELFTYVQIGGRAEDIELVQLLRQGSEFEDERAIADAFDRFDVRECQCFEASEQARIFAIIEAACGSVDAFNISMQGIISDLRLRP